MFIFKDSKFQYISYFMHFLKKLWTVLIEKDKLRIKKIKSIYNVLVSLTSNKNISYQGKQNKPPKTKVHPVFIKK